MKFRCLREKKEPNTQSMKEVLRPLGCPVGVEALTSRKQ